MMKEEGKGRDVEWDQEWEIIRNKEERRKNRDKARKGIKRTEQRK